MLRLNNYAWYIEMLSISEGLIDPGLHDLGVQTEAIELAIHVCVVGVVTLIYWLLLGGLCIIKFLRI